MGLLDHMMANLYKPQKQEKQVVLPKNLTPAKAAKLAAQSTSVTQGQLLKGEVLDLRSNQIMVLLENGATVSARTEGTLNLSIGQHARFLVAQTTEDQILLKLAQEEEKGENPMIDKALNAANIIRTERSVSIVTELLAHKQPVTESNIRHFLSLSTKNPELPAKDLILMELHHIPVTKENVAQFAAYQDRNAKLLTQAQDMIKSLAEAIENLPEGSLKQEAAQELTKLLGQSGTMPSNASETTLTGASQPETAASLPTGSETLPAIGQEPLPEAGQGTANPISDAKDKLSTSISPSSGQAPQAAPESTPHATTMFRSLREHAPLSGRAMLNEFLDSFLLKPEDIADPEKIQNYYDELNEKLEHLEQLSQKLAENTNEAPTGAPKQMRQNLSFLETVNQVFPFVQLPLKFRETPAHGELYVYEKKRALKPSDTLSALLHLELEALGTTDIFVTLAGTHVTTRFSMTDKEAGNLVRSEMPKLTQALAARGYTLQSEVAVREPEEENTPTLLEQFLEEQAPGGLNRYTFDIRA